MRPRFLAGAERPSSPDARDSVIAADQELIRTCTPTVASADGAVDIVTA